MSKRLVGTGLLVLAILCASLPAGAAAPPASGCPAAASTTDFLAGLSTVPPVLTKGFTVCGNGCPALGGTDLSCKGKAVGATCPGGSCMPFISPTCPSSAAHCDCVPR